MPLTFNIRHVENKDQRFEGEAPAAELDLDLHDEMMCPAGPLEYDLEAQWLEGAVLVRGDLRLPMDCTCVRCLKSFRRAIELEDWTCHLELAGDEAVIVSNDLVDLTPQIREDILLALPQHPLCEPECRGLKVPATVKDPGRASEKTSSAWDELNKLKL